MAVGARELLGSTYALATTGVAGPDPQEGHPAGHVWVACAGPRVWRRSCCRSTATGRRSRRPTCRDAMSVLDGMLRREDSGLG